MKKLSLLILCSIFFFNVHAQEVIIVGKRKNNPGPYEFSGMAVDNQSKESLIGVNFYLPALKTGVTTDINGRFYIKLDRGEYELVVSYLGYETLKYVLLVQGDGTYTFNLNEDTQQLDEIVISAERADANVKSTDIGKETLSLEAIQDLPAFVGEVDILKSITLLPGISTVGEASSGFNVRGGGSDQNLILLGGAPLYNSSHFFGFFSAFNSDLIRDVTVFKGGIPANYAGRASSIVDIKYKEGSKTKWSGKTSLGLISTKISADGPLIKDKLTMLIGGRVSYANWLLKRSPDPDIANSSASFYDGNIILSYYLNDNNKISYTYYNSFDDFGFASDTTISWRNQIHTLSYNKTFGPRLFGTASFSRSEYDFDISSDFDFSSFKLESEIVDEGLNADLEFKVTEGSTMTGGIQVKRITISPGSIAPLTTNSNVESETIESESGLEAGIFFQHDLDVFSKLRLSYGLRYNTFTYLGENAVYNYQEFLPRRVENITDTTIYGKNEAVTTYGGFEPRISLRFAFNETTSIKAGYNRIYQYIHLISNTTAIAPTDIWKLSDTHIKPAITQQFSMGIFKNFQNNNYETSVEGYFKDQTGLIDYKDGAELFLNDHLETELLSGIGQAYGLEFYVKKNNGRNRGWFSYTYSRSLRQVIGNFPEETINGGEWFASNFDKPHDLTTVYETRLSPYIDFSAIFTYSTGRPTTYPRAKFDYNGESVAYFLNRNEDRQPDYHRLDMSIDFRLNAVRKIWLGEWKLSVYNVYGRNNAFSVFFDDVVGAPPRAYQLSILGNPFYSASYTVSF